MCLLLLLERERKRCINTDTDSVVGNCDGLCNAGQREPIRNDLGRCCSEQLVLIDFPLGGSRAHSVIAIFVSLEQRVFENLLKGAAVRNRVIIAK